LDLVFEIMTEVSGAAYTVIVNSRRLSVQNRCRVSGSMGISLVSNVRILVEQLALWQWSFAGA
jgi:hypothetical protein